MSTRASTIMLCTLVCALLAGCGSSNGAAPVVPTAVPHKTADIAAVQSRQATAVARANATSVAVQNIASTAVARLKSTATTQSRLQKAANAAKTRPTSAPAAPPTAIPPPTLIPTALPTATPQPLLKPTSATHHTTKKPTKKPRPRSIVTTLASVHCCGRGEFKKAAEKRSKQFATAGTWILRWSTKCANVTNGRQPMMYIAIIPVGSKSPIQFIREPMPTTSTGTGFAAETLHGRYYLDVISPCRAFTAVATGRRGAKISRHTQASAIAEARSKGQARALNAVRTNLLGRSHSKSNAKAKARALAKARTKYVSGVLTVVKQVRAARKTLITATNAINPSVQDFDPSTLQAAKDYVAAANQELVAAQSKLRDVKTLAGHSKPKIKLRNAISHLVDAASLIRKATADMEAGDTNAATTDLDTANAKITTAEHQLKHIASDLKVLKTAG
jgi:hypothetical protein